MQNPDIYVFFPTEFSLEGVHTFVAFAEDYAGNTSDKAVYQITAHNHGPVIPTLEVTTPEDTPVEITLTSTSAFEPVSYRIVTPPGRGTLGPLVGNHVTYTPDPDFNGQGLFTIQANDGTYDGSGGTVRVTVTPVEDAPVAQDGSATTAEDTPRTLNLPTSDADGYPQLETSTVVSGPAHGTLSGTGVTLTYTPEKDYNGPDGFTYKVNDGQMDSNTATFSLTVTPVNDPPAAVPQTVTTDEDAPKAVALTGSDVDGDPLTYSVVTGPAHGALSGTAPALTFTPAADYNGPDSFTFRTHDGALDSAPATVSVTVSPVNDAPVAQDASVTAFRNLPQPVALSATDVDGDALTYTVLTPPSHGALTGVAPSLIYTPEVGYSGPDTFTFLASDGQADSIPATVSLNVLLPLLTVGSATSGPGEASEVTLSLTEAATGIAGLDLRLRAVGPEGAPALVPAFNLTSTTEGWNFERDPNDPWHVSLVNPSPLSGPADVLRLRLLSSPSTPTGAAYRLEAASVVATDAGGHDTDVTTLVAPGQLLVNPCEAREKGDANGDGSVDVADAVAALRVIVDLEGVPNECARAAMDVNCTGTVTVGDAVLILRHIVFGEAFPPCQ